MPLGLGPAVISGPGTGRPNSPGGESALPGSPPSPAAPALLVQEAVKARSRISVIAGTKNLISAMEKALPVLGASSDEGAEIVRALTSLRGLSTAMAEGLEEAEAMAQDQAQAPAPLGSPVPITQPGGMPRPPVGAPSPPALGAMGAGPMPGVSFPG